MPEWLKGKFMASRCVTTPARRRAFEGLSDRPCGVCRELAEEGVIGHEAVMPLPPFPARLRSDGRPCCRDCQATETTQAAINGQHPSFGPARLTVANERIEGLRMPRGLMENFGMCRMGFIEPCSLDDLENHQAWLEKHGISWCVEIDE